MCRILYKAGKGTAKKLNFMIEEMCMTGLNFRQISFVYRKFGSVIYIPHVKDGSDILMQGT